MPQEYAELLQGAHKVLQKTGTYDRVINWLKRKAAHDVIVVGATGTGKSSFLESLKGTIPHIRRDFRTNKVTPHNTNVGGSYFYLLDTPGEREHRDKRRRAIAEAQKSKALGIINIVSFGYHEGLSPLAQALEQERPRPSFLEERRDIELVLINEWLPLLCGPGGAAKWAMTVVTKADLWWEGVEDDPVLDYYRSGRYFAKIKGVMKQIPHSVHSYSSVNQPFYGRVPMSGHYSDEKRDNDRIAIIARMLENASLD